MPLLQHNHIMALYNLHSVLTWIIPLHFPKLQCCCPKMNSYSYFRYTIATYLYAKILHNDVAIVLRVASLLGSGTVLFKFSVQIFPN
jgi:hypothetical protein